MSGEVQETDNCNAVQSTVAYKGREEPLNPV